jgi:glycosidase
MVQAFNWESWKQSGGWYNLLMGKVDDIASAGVTHVWLPPPSHSVSTQGTVHLEAALIAVFDSRHGVDNTPR